MGADLVIGEDRITDDLLAETIGLDDVSEDALVHLEGVAAWNFAAYTLHRDMPAARQGSRDDASWARRDQRAAAAKELWLAIQNERWRRAHA